MSTLQRPTLNQIFGRPVLRFFATSFALQVWQKNNNNNKIIFCNDLILNTFSNYSLAISQPNEKSNFAFVKVVKSCEYLAWAFKVVLQLPCLICAFVFALLVCRVGWCSPIACSCYEFESQDFSCPEKCPVSQPKPWHWIRDIWGGKLS